MSAGLSAYLWVKVCLVGRPVMWEETEKLWFQMRVDPEGRDRTEIFHLDQRERGSECWSVAQCESAVWERFTSERQRSGQAVQGVRVLVQRVQFQLGLRQSGTTTRSALIRCCRLHNMTTQASSVHLLLPQEGVLPPDVRQLSLCRSGSQLRMTTATFFITYSRCYCCY